MALLHALDSGLVQVFEKVAPAGHWRLGYWAWVFHRRFKDFWCLVLAKPDDGKVAAGPYPAAQ